MQNSGRYTMQIGQRFHYSAYASGGRNVQSGSNRTVCSRHLLVRLPRVYLRLSCRETLFFIRSYDTLVRPRGDRELRKSDDILH